jgi:hypothetical protein
MSKKIELIMCNTTVRKMNIYSRSYLKGLPEKLRKEAVSRAITDMITKFEGYVTYAASQGQTSYLYEPSQPHMKPSASATAPVPVVTNEDLIPAIQERFSECTVTYEERWVYTDQNTRVLKKGILIDWS